MLFPLSLMLETVVPLKSCRQNPLENSIFEMEIVERFVLVLFVDDIFGPFLVGVVQTMCQFGWPAKTTRHWCDRPGSL